MGGEFDFARAEARIRADVDRVAGRAHHDDDMTRQLAALQSTAESISHLENLVLVALRNLPVAYGGLSVSGTWPTFHPLVRVLRRVRSHPSWRDARRDEWTAKADLAVGERGALPWSSRHAIDEVVAGARHFLRNAELRGDVEPWQPSDDPVARPWMSLFCFLVAADELGALDETFARDGEVVR